MTMVFYLVLILGFDDMHYAYSQGDFFYNPKAFRLFMIISWPLVIAVQCYGLSIYFSQGYKLHFENEFKNEEFGYLRVVVDFDPCDTIAYD